MAVTDTEQPAAAPETRFTARANYHSADNNFEFRWPDVPAHQFLVERDKAFASDTPTCLIPLDCSEILKTGYPATTPTMLMRYARIRAGEEISTRLVASGEIYYVMEGSGESRNGEDVIAWGRGDLFCFPGGGETTHRAGDVDCLLYFTTNEPLLALERLRPPAPGEAVVETVHWPAASTRAEFEDVFKRPITPTTTGHAVLFSSPALAPSTNAIPSINIGINTLEAGRDQRAHRHNGVAVVLSIQGEGVYSIVDDERIDWAEGAVQITPGASMHSHHNRGSERMECLIFQDEALHYYTRTPGFSFD
ncbi:MAG: cupin domain-containing protein [Rhodospirillaceae bacterium]|jgi:gentisate 1,2-dioxygenase|nr:cupin domain-containing protein [Rhodospirillaceae bacterium]